MAGIAKIHCIGEEGGFMGSDGLNPIAAQIWEGHSDRMWYEARYFEPGIAPLGRLKTIVPESPDPDPGLLDACLAFFPIAFAHCPSLAKVQAELGDRESLDFHHDAKSIPPSWASLREEAREAFANLAIWSAELVPVHPRRGMAS